MITKLPKASPVDGLYWQIATLVPTALPEREVQFYASRGWRFDLAWRQRRLAVEVEGGTWSRKLDDAGGRRQTRHTTGAGFREDCLKYSVAALQGWTVLRVTTDMVLSGDAALVVAAVLDGDPNRACASLSGLTRRPKGDWTGVLRTRRSAPRKG